MQVEVWCDRLEMLSTRSFCPVQPWPPSWIAHTQLYQAVQFGDICSLWKRPQDVQKLRNPLWVWIVSTYSFLFENRHIKEIITQDLLFLNLNNHDHHRFFSCCHVSHVLSGVSPGCNLPPTFQRVQRGRPACQRRFTNCANHPTSASI